MSSIDAPQSQSQSQSQPRTTDTVAGFLAAMSMAICLIGIAWHPLRLILPGIVIAMIAAGMGGRFQRLAFAAVVVAAGSFFLGMLIAVVTQNPLW
jgi:hypothetical protein